MFAKLDKIHIFVEPLIMIAFVILCTFLWLLIYLTLFIVLQKQPQYKNNFSPAVSVIIAAKNEAHNLSEYLPKILSQEYLEFEVIVAVNQSTDNTVEVLQSLKMQYSNLNILIIDKIPKDLSPKKYALTQAIEQAKYEYLLFTDADCIPNSKLWIKKMISPFENSSIEIVLGYSPYQQANTLLNHFIQYETIFTAIQYLGLAKLGLPYMGVGRNLAYKKSLFEKHTFDTHKHILSGDDDLFVNQAGHRKNTTIQTNTKAWTYSIPKKNWQSWYRQKSRHISTGKHYKLLHLFILGILSLLNVSLPFLGFLYFLIQEKFYIFAFPLMLTYLYTTLLFRKYRIRIKPIYFILLPFLYSLYQVLISIKGIFSKQNTTW